MSSTTYWIVEVRFIEGVPTPGRKIVENPEHPVSLLFDTDPAKLAKGDRCRWVWFGSKPSDRANDGGQLEVTRKPRHDAARDAFYFEWRDGAGGVAMCELHIVAIYGIDTGEPAAASG